MSKRKVYWLNVYWNVKEEYFEVTDFFETQDEALDARDLTGEYGMILQDTVPIWFDSDD